MGDEKFEEAINRAHGWAGFPVDAKILLMTDAQLRRSRGRSVDTTTHDGLRVSVPVSLLKPLGNRFSHFRPSPPSPGD